jgi:hypothetical protein
MSNIKDKLSNEKQGEAEGVTKQIKSKKSLCHM